MSNTNDRRESSSVGNDQTTETNPTARCPVCDCSQISLLTPTWKRFHDEKKYFISEREWFVNCETCGTIFRFPLISYDDYRKYGEDYYDQVNQDQTVEEHAVEHFESFQRSNYDSLRAYLNQHLPPETGKKWLDVGSIGYITSFDEYQFTTIEPDERIVNVGRRIFKPGGIKSLLRVKPRIHCHTIESYDTSELFDGIVFHNSFYCLPFPLDGLKKAARLLNQNGHLLITISTFFCDAVAVRTDGKLSRMEDVLPGETLWVFHNPKSLEYLCSRAGFELVSSHEIPAYGKKTMRLFRFRKVPSYACNSTLLDESKKTMGKKLELVFKGFSEQTSSAIARHNRGDVFFVGSLQMLNDLSVLSGLGDVKGYVVFDSVIGECEINGVRCLNWDKFQSVIEQNPGRYSAVIFSYKFQDEIYGKLATLKSDLSAIYRPNRKSGLESLFLCFAGESRPSKGMTLDQVD